MALRQIQLQTLPTESNKVQPTLPNNTSTTHFNTYSNQNNQCNLKAKKSTDITTQFMNIGNASANSSHNEENLHSGLVPQLRFSSHNQPIYYRNHYNHTHSHYNYNNIIPINNDPTINSKDVPVSHIKNTKNNSNIKCLNKINLNRRISTAGTSKRFPKDFFRAEDKNLQKDKDRNKTSDNYSKSLNKREPELMLKWKQKTSDATKDINKEKGTQRSCDRNNRMLLIPINKSKRRNYNMSADIELQISQITIGSNGNSSHHTLNTPKFNQPDPHKQRSQDQNEISEYNNQNSTELQNQFLIQLPRKPITQFPEIRQLNIKEPEDPGTIQGWNGNIFGTCNSSDNLGEGYHEGGTHTNYHRQRNSHRPNFVKKIKRGQFIKLKLQSNRSLSKNNEYSCMNFNNSITTTNSNSLASNTCTNMSVDNISIGSSIRPNFTRLYSMQERK